MIFIKTVLYKGTGILTCFCPTVVIFFIIISFISLSECVSVYANGEKKICHIIWQRTSVASGRIQ